MSLDLTDSLAPKSDQLDAIELVSGPRTFTIEAVSKNGNDEQPFNFRLSGFPRVWRPGLSMRRVIVRAWGPKAETYVGKRITLYFDPNVRFGKEQTGGTRISHMSGLDKPLTMPLPVTRGKSAMYTVQPLPDAPAPDPAPYIDPDVITAWVTKFDEATTLEELQAIWGEAASAGVTKNAEVFAAKEARKLVLT